MATDLHDRIPDSVPDDIELFEEGGEVHGRDERGEFKLNPMAGSAELKGDRCGAVLTRSQARYGQTRYCTMLPVGKFPDTSYKHDEYCKNHQSRYALMERAEELFEHGYFATNYVNFAEKLPPHKFIFAVEIFRGLLEQSTHQFDADGSVHVLDTSNVDVLSDDEVAVELPVELPETFTFQANELWTASLKQVMSQNMQESIFEDGMAVRSLTDSAEMEGTITDTKYESTEHHLHLPLSRVAKDIKEHLKNGGVSVNDDDSAVVTFQQQDYTLDVAPEETDSDGTEDASKVAEDFAERMQSED